MQHAYRLRGDRGSWTERNARGDPEPRGKAERPGTAQRLDGDPQGPDPGNAGEETTPQAVFDRAAIGHGPGSPGRERGTGRRAGDGCHRPPYRADSARSLWNACCRTTSGTACGWLRGSGRPGRETVPLPRLRNGAASAAVRVSEGIRTSALLTRGSPEADWPTRLTRW